MASSISKTVVTETSTGISTVATWVAVGKNTALTHSTKKTIPWTTTYTETLGGSSTNAAKAKSSSGSSSTANTDDANTTNTATVSATASSSASAKATTPATHHSSSHFSKGTLAGVAVACAVGGLLIGLVAAWLLFRRRRKNTTSPTTAVSDSKGHAKPTLVASHSSNNSDPRLDQFLLDATPDREIKNELQALGHLIEQHVENNYHLGPTASVSAVSQTLMQLGFHRSADAVAATCVKTQSRRVGLRHVISQVVFNSVDTHSRSRLTMLPAPIAAFLQSVPPKNDLAASLALSQWRRLSAFLLHPNPSGRDALPVLESTVSSQAAALANALNTFLHYFVAPDEASRDAQTKHLQDVISECTKLGYVLLSQPQDWHFVFEKDGSGLVVVCPGLDKVGGHDGPGRRVVEPNTVRLDSVRG